MKTTIALLVLGLLAGCRSAADAFVDDLCACRGDKACVEELGESMETLTSRYPEYKQQLERGLKDDKLKARMRQCLVDDRYSDRR